MDRHLDRKIGEVIYGFEIQSVDEYGDITVKYKGKEFALPYYSSNIADTEKVIKVLTEAGYTINLNYLPDGKREAIVRDGCKDYKGTHRSAPMAIVLAIKEILNNKPNFNLKGVTNFRVVS